ncbi:hypothetical protein H2248_003290 [Termitomyces sp. 'cryptogamus']|nr:hypothetical protein H2248_003290 [Termitomyces sp. 'cryptogamus']
MQAVLALATLATSWTSNRATDHRLTGTVIDSDDSVHTSSYVWKFVLNLMRERGDMANVPPEDQLRVAGKEEENYSYACHDS